MRLTLSECNNICNICVYAPCVCGNEPDNCASYVEEKVDTHLLCADMEEIIDATD